MFSRKLRENASRRNEPSLAYTVNAKMKTNKLACIAAAFFLIIAAISMAAQTTPRSLKRTITKTDRFDFGAGGTVAITGAPNGSIRVEGSAKNEIEITAVIEIEAATEADLARLAAVTTFTTDESASRTSVISVGTHDKAAIKKLAKKFPKNLFGLPFRIDYVIHVPRYSDLEIDGGKGDLSITGVEGSLRVNFLETNAKIEIIGGSTTVIIGRGTVDVALGVRGWKGRAASVQVATGNLTVRLPSSASAEIDALILRTGAIENLIPDLKPRDRKVAFTDKAIFAKAGVGGVPLKFTVGDGILKMESLTIPL